MRFVPLSCLREGMVLAENLYYDSNNLMLIEGTRLTKKNVEAIKRFGYYGAYIDDDISKDISIVNVVNDKVRYKTLKNIKKLFIQSEEGYVDIRDNLEIAKQQIESIVDEIYTNQNLLINLIDLKTFDDYTYNHSVNVSIMSIALGVSLGMTKKELCDLGFAALLHDIGKVFVNREILNKKSKLTDTEFDEMKKHSILGYRHIQNRYEVSEEVLRGILEHHEKYGGGGYPNNLKGNNISIFARIIAAADVYDALTSDRPYRKAFLPADAVEYIMASIITQFDPEVVNAFVTKIAPYPVGTYVNLSNGSKAIIVENNKETCLRPKVRIIKKQDKKVKPYVVDLADYRFLNVIITEIL